MTAELLSLLWVPFLMCLVLTGIHAYLGVHVLVGSLLSVRGTEIVKVALLYALIGLLHWLCRRPFFLISTDPEAAFREGWRVRLWDFVFYASFGVVVTSSVRVAGVLLVFSYLIVPALAGTALGGTVATRLIIGWSFGTLVSVLGMAASAAFDLPTGATVVCAFGLTLLVFAVIAWLLGWRPTTGAAVMASAIGRTRDGTLR